MTGLARLVVVAALLCASLLCGCGPSDEKLEARSILDAIERVRKAEHAERAALLSTLEAAKPADPDVERARARCASAFRAMHDARSAVQHVKKRMAEHAKDKTEPDPSLLTTLSSAQKSLNEANDRMPACDAAVRTLRTLAR